MKQFGMVLGLALALMLTGCGKADSGVFVQRADQLSAAGRAAQRYVGMVVSENVVEINRDSSKTVETLHVTLGQEVKTGDKLFTYDSAALELDLEKAQLEVEKMSNEQTTYAEQLKKLEDQLKRTYNESAKVRLTLEINTLKTEIMENDYNLAAKETEITKLTDMLQNIDITSPVDGTVRAVNDQNQQEAGAYITIQQAGAYRVRGMVNEMNLGSGIQEGTRIRAFSRVDPAQTWTGTVVSIDLDGSSQENLDMWGNQGMMDTMTTSSSYPFFVEMDSLEGLLLGQHIYMEVLTEDLPEGLWVPETFLTELTLEETTGTTTAAMFVAGGRDRLERRTVTLGMYDGTTGCYQILSGLDGQDYAADPRHPGCEAGARVLYREAADFAPPAATQAAPETQGSEAPEETRSSAAAAETGEETAASAAVEG